MGDCNWFLTDMPQGRRDSRRKFAGWSVFTCSATACNKYPRRTLPSYILSFGLPTRNPRFGVRAPPDSVAYSCRNMQPRLATATKSYAPLRKSARICCLIATRRPLCSSAGCWALTKELSATSTWTTISMNSRFGSIAEPVAIEASRFTVWSSKRWALSRRRTRTWSGTCVAESPTNATRRGDLRQLNNHFMQMPVPSQSCIKNWLHAVTMRGAARPSP